MENMSLAAVQDALKSAPIGILFLNNENKIEWHNDTLPKLLDLGEENIVGKAIDKIDDELRDILVNPPETFVLQNGENQRWLRCNCQDTEENSRIHFYTDISEEQRLRMERDQLAEDLEQLSTRDPITGLPNRHALLQGLEPLVSRSRRYGNPLSIIKLNISLEGNDHPSETQQRETWTQVAQLLKDHMRWADIIGRFDGGDFLLILPETSQDAAELLATKISTLINEQQLHTADGNTFQIKPSYGITSWTKGDDAALMLHRVNEEMAEAKQKGATPA